MFSEALFRRRRATDHAETGWPIPRSWRIVRFGSVGRIRSRQGATGLELLSVYLGRGVIPYTEGGKRVHSPSLDLVAYQEVREGDLVMNNQQAWRGSVGVSRLAGIVSPAYLVYEIASEIDPGYARHLFVSPVMVDQYVTSSKGVGDIQRTIYEPYLKMCLVPMPPLDEQAAIVKYLGHAHARIDRAIAGKRKLIALLEEQKQAIIHRAVTRGLDPSAPLKDSGFPWIGEIPRHWEIERAKYIIREVDDRSTSGVEEQLSVSHITGVSPRKPTVTMFRAESYIGHKICRPDDLVVNTMWAWMGALGVAHNLGIVSPSYGVYRLKHKSKVRAEYLELMLRTPQYISYFKSESTGIRPSRLRLYPDQMLATPLPIPPVSEQLEIVEHLESSGKSFERIRVQALAEIELLREFRTRLTADVVTGQIDVREIAVTLPELREAAPSLWEQEFDNEDYSVASEVEFENEYD